MYPIPWYVVLLETIPETLIVLKLGFKLFELDIDIKKALLISLINGIFTYFIRKLPLVFGVHTILIILFLTLLTALFLRYSSAYCFASVAAGGVILGILQSILLPLMLNATSKSINYLDHKPWLNILYFIPVAGAMLIIYLGVSKYGLILYSKNNTGIDSGDEG